MHRLLHIKETAKSGLHFFSNAIFPPSCIVCQAPVDASNSICSNCFSKAVMISDPMCFSCGVPFEHDMAGDSNEYALCGRCVQHPPPYHKARAALVYDETSKKIITRIKYSDRTDIIPMAARLMAQAGHDLWDDADMIIPVPMHWKRLVRRKYNQSFLLARNLSKMSGVRLEPDILIRHKNTPPQASLDFKARQKNVKGVFSVKENMKGKIKGRSIILVDDVITTGATINSCTKLLKNAGASKIYIIALARRFITG